MIDFVRILVGLLTWNSRKTVYRFTKARCPCQALGDDPQAGHSRCEAAMDYDRPHRFKVVCPALIDTDKGLRCQLARTQVRPFWGRAFAIYGAILLAGYLTFATAWFALLQHRGMAGVAWLDCVIPTRFENIAFARANFFKSNAAGAIKRGEFTTAIYSLSAALGATPTDWKNGLILARLYEYTGQFAQAESLYANLLADFPQHRNAILLAHHDSLLVSQRLRSLRDLAEAEFYAQPTKDSPWLLPWLSLSLASPREFQAKKNLGLAEATTTAIDTLIEFANHPPAFDRTFVAQSLVSAVMPSPLLARLRWELLWRSGNGPLARTAVLKDAGTLGAFEANLALAITIDPRVNDTDYLNFWQDLINTTEIGPTHVERIAAIGVNSSRRLPLSSLRIKISNSDRASLSALWVLAIAQRDDSLRRSLEAQLGIENEPTLTELTADQLSKNLALITSVLPIPREVLYGITFAAAMPAG